MEYIDQLNSIIEDVNIIIKFFIIYFTALWVLSTILFAVISDQIEKAKNEILNQIKNNQK